MSTNREVLEDKIKEVLEEVFPGTEIRRVLSKSMLDNDGDPILRIFVVLGDSEKELDPKAQLGLIRKLRTRLGYDEFPVVSFYSSAEAKKLNLEAA